MPFCRECGKEVQEDWNSCPYCNISTGTATVQNKVIDVQNVVIEPNNTALWNVVVIAITLGILFWPHGLFEITLFERATTDCSVLNFAGTDARLQCEEWKTEGITYLGITIIVSSFLLLLINTNQKDKTNHQKDVFQVAPAEQERIPRTKEQIERENELVSKIVKNSLAIIVIILVMNYPFTYNESPNALSSPIEANMLERASYECDDTQIVNHFEDIGWDSVENASEKCDDWRFMGGVNLGYTIIVSAAVFVIINIKKKARKRRNGDLLDESE